MLCSLACCFALLFFPSNVLRAALLHSPCLLGFAEIPIKPLLFLYCIVLYVLHYFCCVRSVAHLSPDCTARSSEWRLAAQKKGMRNEATRHEHKRCSSYRAAVEYVCCSQEGGWVGRWVGGWVRSPAACFSGCHSLPILGTFV